MSSLEFEDQSGGSINKRFQYQEINGSSFLVKHHIVDNEKSSERVMIFLLIIFLIATGLTITKLYKDNQPKEVKYNLSSEVIKKLPLDIQEKILLQ